jgi:hypothetical protein
LPYDVLRWAYRSSASQKSFTAAAVAERSWAAAAALREQQVAGNSSSRFIMLGLQALPLLQLQDGHEVRSGVEHGCKQLPQWRCAAVLHPVVLLVQPCPSASVYALGNLPADACTLA